MKKYRLIILICFYALVSISCGQRKEKHTSPNGVNTITVEYDLASRPSIEYKGDRIWEYPGSGFNEEVFFNVEWIDDDSFKFIYNDESHSGQYAEEFEIVLE